MAVRTQTYTKKDGTVSVYTFEREYKDRTTHILVPDGVHKPYWVKVPPTSILFKEKDYPTCLGCDRKYLHELGCLWCKIKRDGNRKTDSNN